MRCVIPAGLRPWAPRAGTQAPWCCFSLLPRLAHPETPSLVAGPPTRHVRGPRPKRRRFPEVLGPTGCRTAPRGCELAPGSGQWCPELKWKRGLFSVSLRVRQPRLGKPALGVLGGRVQRWPPGPAMPKSRRPGKSPMAGPVLGLWPPLPTWSTGGRARSFGPVCLSSRPPQRAFALVGWTAWGAGFSGWRVNT